MLRVKDKIILSPLYAASLLPLSVMYLFSDMLFVMAYYVIGYRKKVVLKNLIKSFPEKSNAEINNIIRKFYSHLCDVFIESLKMLNISKKTAYKRFKLVNPELIEGLVANNKSVILATSHFGNWEWGGIFADYFKGKALAVYRPLANKMFDRFFINLRSGFGGVLVPMKQTLREIVTAQRQKQLFTLYLLSDQRPGLEDMPYCTSFLNQETPMISGGEKLAKKFNLAVVFIDCFKIKRGYYNVTFRLITENPGDEPENQITEKYARMLEKMVQKQPECWLWSHKRWKFSLQDYINHKEKTK